MDPSHADENDGGGGDFLQCRRKIGGRSLARVRLPSSGTAICRYRHPLTGIQYPIPSSNSG